MTELEPITTEEWMKLPLTASDVDAVDEFLSKEGGFRSDWPWPTINKVLQTARDAIGGEDG